MINAERRRQIQFFDNGVGHVGKFGIFIPKCEDQIKDIVRRDAVLAALIPSCGIQRVDGQIRLGKTEHQVQIASRIFQKGWIVQEIREKKERMIADVVIGAGRAFGIFAVFVAVDALHQEAVDRLKKFRILRVSISNRKGGADDPAMIRRMEAER